MKRLFYALFIVIIAAGCGSISSILNSCKAPGETMNPDEYKKVMVVAYVKDEIAMRKYSRQPKMILWRTFSSRIPLKISNT